MPLTRYEQETVIRFCEAEDTADVFTYNEKWQRHLESLGFKPYRVNDFGGKDYAIPKHMIHLPRKKLELTETERARRHPPQGAPTRLSTQDLAHPPGLVL